MSILDRLNLLVRSELGARKGGPSASEVRSTLREASASLSEVRRIERQLDSDYETLRASMDREEANAVRALESGDEEGARLSLERKAVLERDAEAILLDRDDARERLEQLRSALRSLEDRTGLGRNRSPEGDFSATSPTFSRFSEMEERLSAMEASTAAAVSLVDPLHDPRDAAIEHDFSELEARRELRELGEKDSGSALDRLRRMMNEDE